MQLFLQFDIEERFGTPFKAGSHFVLFMCPECNEIPSFEADLDSKLPNEYWLTTEKHFYAALFKPEELVAPSHAAKSLLQSFGLSFSLAVDTHLAEQGLRVGGEPDWIQDAENHVCCCGAEMRLICQIPENFGFPKTISAPEQPDSFSSEDYCLFLGNEIYAFGCSRQCDVRAVWITVQS
jgi:hypothetical protein